MAAWRTWSVLAGLLLPAVGFGQNCNLTEAPKVGECYRYTVETVLEGTMKVAQDGKEKEIKLTAKNEHVWLERILAAEKGVVRKSARHYEKALCAGEVGDEKIRRGLRDERRLIVAQRLEDHLLCFSLAGPVPTAGNPAPPRIGCQAGGVLSVSPCAAAVTAALASAAVFRNDRRNIFSLIALSLVRTVRSHL